MNTTRAKRIKSIDMLRGLVMVIMALDHVRDYFHYDAFFYDPSDLSQTSVGIFWTRFITHFCAPVFVFLAGTSAFFVGQRRSKKELSIWLLKRGIWLVIAEVTIIKFAWMFKLDFSTVVLQVIWVLGIAMIFLAGFIHLPKKLNISLAILFVIGHNLFDSYSPTGPVSSGIWTFLHIFGVIPMGNITILSGYPMIPWVFVMLLGYHFGELYKPSYGAEKRKKALIWLGLGMLLAFVIIRATNIYGDAIKWEVQDTASFTVLSFFNLTKYPPSLLFLLVTLGIPMIFLAFAENWRGKLTEWLVVIGRVPMFFYIIHLYVIHFFALLAAMATGFQASDMVIDLWITLQPELQGYGFSLWVVYLIWLILIIALYPICKWYDGYKTRNRQYWWLSYL